MWPARNGRRDILAANRLGYALYSEVFVDPVRPANVARFVFLSPRAGAFFPDWEGVASDWWPACALRPADPGLSLVVYGAEPGSASQDGLQLLASWAATLDQPAAVQAPDLA